MIPAFGHSSASLLPKNAIGDMSVSDYLDLYYSDSKDSVVRIKYLLDDTLNWLISMDIFSRETQGAPLFCSNNKNDPINIDVDTFNGLLMSNLSRLNVHDNILSVKSILPFAYYVLGVMAERYPCKGSKPFNLFGRIESSYDKANASFIKSGS